MQNSDPILRTKLRQPAIRQGLVSRPALLAQIKHGFSVPLTLITAPAGFGKTTLVAACVADCEIPVAWLSVDKNDNQVGRFLHYLVAALQETNPAVGKQAAQMLAAAPDAVAEAVMISLINDLDAAGGELILVLDDYQLITNPVVHEVVAFLLDHCPSTLHLVIDTRSDPPLPLSRLRARGQIFELRTSDLRFTIPETFQFLNHQMGLNLDDGAIATLEERTEGWIAGLQMAALSMRGRQDIGSFIQEFAGTNRFIMDFMLEEVLARETEAVQTFLLETAVLNRLTGPLCDAVTGSTGGQAMLEQLERRNLFVVPLDNDRRWYRYHHLFADLLQAKLYQSGQEHVASLLTRAAVWCEQDGQISEAVSYALAARNELLAASFIETYWHQKVNNGEIETVFSWLNALSPALLKNSASLSAAFCMVLWLTGQVGAIEEHLENAERALAQQDEANQTGAAFYPTELPVVLAAMHSFVARYHEQFETAVALAEHALRLIPEDFPAPGDAELRSLAYLALGSGYDGVGDLEKAVRCYVETIHGSRLVGNATGVAGITFRMVGALRLLGRLREAEAACRAALEFFEANDMHRLPAAGILHVAMSAVLVERNEFAAAEAHLAQGIELGKWSGRLNASQNAIHILCRLKLAQQDPAAAMSTVQEVERGLAQPASNLLKAELCALRARILIDLGAISEAAQQIERADRLTGQEQGQTRSIVDLAACRLFAAQHPPEEAVVQLSQALERTEARGRMGAAIEMRILRCLALAQLGKTQEAEADLGHSLNLAEREGFVRVFLDEGKPMQKMIEHWLAHAKPGPPRDYAIRLLAQFNDDPGRVVGNSEKQPSTAGLPAPAYQSSAAVLVEPLSRRELEVLQRMALGCTNEAIARQLIVTRGTIKAHAASIYRKLDVANRTEAVARARQLGLLP